MGGETSLYVTPKASRDRRLRASQETHQIAQHETDEWDDGSEISEARRRMFRLMQVHRDGAVPGWVGVV